MVRKKSFKNQLFFFPPLLSLESAKAISCSDEKVGRNKRGGRHPKQLMISSRPEENPIRKIWSQQSLRFLDGALLQFRLNYYNIMIYIN